MIPILQLKIKNKQMDEQELNHMKHQKHEVQKKFYTHVKTNVDSLNKQRRIIEHEITFDLGENKNSHRIMMRMKNSAKSFVSSIMK